MSSFITHSDMALAVCQATDCLSKGSALSAIREMHEFKIFMQKFLNVCDRKRETDSCSLCASGKISKPLILLVFSAS